MTKAEARKYFLEQRKRLTEEDYQLAHKKLYEQVRTFLTKLKPQTVHCFLPILKSREVNTWPIIAWLHEQNIKVVVPRSNLQNNSMLHFQLTQEIQCVENAWGIPEPQGEYLVTVTEQELKVVLVPLLAFDLEGHRVGYGKGYYDVFLGKCLPETFRIGLSFFDPIPRITDVNSYDIRLSHAITPDQVWDFTDSKP